MSQLDPNTYAEAKKAAMALKAELEPLILGRIRAAWACCCGAISNGESSAIKIVPAGLDPRYENQIGLWYMWSVKMREINSPKPAPNDYSYSIGISQFVDVSTLTEMFQRHFSGIDVEVAR
jgi:hypothetical protein